MKYNIRLACDHVVRYMLPRPTLGAVIFCSRCDDYREVRRSYTTQCGHKTFHELNTALSGRGFNRAWCDVCKSEQLVQNGYETDYHVKCRHCRSSTKCGSNWQHALRNASRHAMKKQGHLVDVFNGDVLEETIGTGTAEATLPFETVIADRLATSQRMAAQLKRLDGDSQDPVGSSVAPEQQPSKDTQDGLTGVALEVQAAKTYEDKYPF